MNILELLRSLCSFMCIRITLRSEIPENKSDEKIRSTICTRNSRAIRRKRTVARCAKTSKTKALSELATKAHAYFALGSENDEIYTAARIRYIIYLVVLEREQEKICRWTRRFAKHIYTKALWRYFASSAAPTLQDNLLYPRLTAHLYIYKLYGRIMVSSL